MDAFRAAGEQNAFIFLNHPHWYGMRSDAAVVLTDVQQRLLEDGLLHGIEVVSDRTYSDEALRIALDHDLAILGTSDIHGLVDWQYDVPRGGHRPVTLLFAEERSPAGIRTALDARRTAAWYENTLVGRQEHLLPLVQASLSVAAAYEWTLPVLKVEIANRSDVEYLLRNRTSYTFYDSADLLTLPPHDTTTVRVKTRERIPAVDLVFEVLNAVVAPNRHLEITLRVETGFEPAPETPSSEGGDAGG